MSVTIKARVYYQPEAWVEANPDLLQAAKSAVNFLQELTTDTFPEFKGDLTLSLDREFHEGREYLFVHLQLMDDRGGKGMLDGIEVAEFLNPVARDRKLFQLWRNVLWNRYAIVQERLESLDMDEVSQDAQP